LNDSICGVTNSLSIGKVELPLGGFLKADSRVNVLKVCLLDDDNMLCCTWTWSSKMAYIINAQVFPKKGRVVSSD
jgi:hypothetical protein